jgi:CheY-like chemotaxis protein
VKPPKVLVVDDSKEIRACIGLVLRASGYRVLEAEDGLAAQSILVNEHPDLVLTDLEMPVCDGWDVLAFCHAHQPATPVMVLSGVARGQRPDLEYRAAAYLTKPFSLARLRAEIQRLAPLAA